ncbi:hypothetical protein [Marinibactrum halimedae]|uniref:Uncharacterized protein n=1 Tax=Marinibactrum halimedae TaxID=1444977 RepID=A0AA37T674_9GAMM|nr:hypothetical protein [Marinibactrum halimedae]MCD9458838.1 hypothetical protein [Marinibactrum halimedae]GLS27690.1 hypothetical protein GCM10007877_34090 [Marinibactrum halimedae]
MQTLVVTTLQDSMSSSSDGKLSLREALQQARSINGELTITFDPSLIGGTINVETTLDVLSSLTIDGDIDGDGQPDITLDGRDKHRVIYTGESTSVKLKGLVIQNGNAENSDSNKGGNIVAGGDLTVEDSIVSSGKAWIGGGIATTYPADNLSIINSEIVGNVAEYKGGGIYYYSVSEEKTFTIKNSLVQNNSATKNGGGINSVGKLNIEETLFQNNNAGKKDPAEAYEAGSGGAVSSEGRLSVLRSTFNENTVTHSGGALSVSGISKIIRSTFTGNTANTDGGAISQRPNTGGRDYPLSVYSSTFTGNASTYGVAGIFMASGKVRAANSLFSHNVTTWSPDGSGATDSSFDQGNYNSVKEENLTNLIDIDPELVFSEINTINGGGLLADNGGATPTVALKNDPANPAIDAARTHNSDILDSFFNPIWRAEGNLEDQRGAAADDGNGDGEFFGDIGAFEVKPFFDLVVTSLEDGTEQAKGLTLRHALEQAKSIPEKVRIVFHSDLAGGVIKLSQGPLVLSSNIYIDGFDSNIYSSPASEAEIDLPLQSNITIDAGGESRAFIVDNNSEHEAEVMLRNLNIEGGYEGQYSGGAILNEEKLSLKNVKITNSKAPNGDGGAIRNNGHLRIYNSIFRHNEALNGGVIGNGGYTIIRDSKLSDNIATKRGGALHTWGQAVVLRSTVTRNSAELGGGIFDTSDTGLYTEDSTIANNIANKGGGIFYSDSINYAAIWESTITGNSANDEGGGIYIGSSDKKINIHSSIVSGNKAKTHQNIDQTLLLSESSLNLVDVEPGLIFEEVDEITGGGKLTSIETFQESAALKPKSDNPAIDGGDAITGEDVDQLGNHPFNSVKNEEGVYYRDIGAVELSLYPKYITVTSLSDDESSDGITLRKAIEMANNDVSGVHYTIGFHKSLLGGTIKLQQGALKIASNLSIVSPRKGITIDAQGGSRVLIIDDAKSDDNSEVSLVGLTITGGHSASGDGGGILNKEKLGLWDVTIKSNHTDGGGGGIYNDVTGNLYIKETLIQNNTASYGGGVANKGALELIDSQISSNKVSGSGGGISSWGSSLVAKKSTIRDNVADSKGGGIIKIGQEKLELNGVSIINNKAGFEGGGIYANKGLEVAFTTVTSNASEGVTAGIFIEEPDDNSKLLNSIVTGNVANNSGDVENISDVSLHTRSKNLINVNPRLVFEHINPNTGGGDFDQLGAVRLKNDPSNPAIDNANPVNAAVIFGAHSEVVDGNQDGFLNADFGAFEMNILRVTHLEDDVNKQKGLSLRQAIEIANKNYGMIIEFSEDLAGGTLLLEQGALNITGAFTINGDIDGDGKPDVSIDAAGNSRVFNVDNPGYSSELYQAPVLNGLIISGGYSENGGGAGINLTGTLYLSNSIVENNQARDGAGIYARTAESPIDPSGGYLTIENSQVRNNQGQRDGGGIYALTGLNIYRSTISGNDALNLGGGVVSKGATEVVNSTVANNSAETGAGFYASNSMLFNVLQTTVTGNKASATAGGIYIGQSVNYSLIHNSIVSGNSDTDGNANVYGNFDNNSNLIDYDPANIFAAIDDVTGGGVLLDLGGATPTVPLNAESANPALNASTTMTVAGLNLLDYIADQRGQASSGVRDLGAFELAQIPSLKVTTVDDNVNFFDDKVSLREALYYVNSGLLTGTITFDAELLSRKIVLKAGELHISRDVTIDGDVDGDGVPDIILDANQSSRVLTIQDKSTQLKREVTLKNLVITGGLEDGVAGGIHNFENLLIENSVIKNNQAQWAGGIRNEGNLTIQRSQIRSNVAKFSGGIGNSADLIITESSVSGNIALHSIGGISNTGTLNVMKSTISRNVAEHHAGGVRNTGGGDAYFEYTTIANNEAAGQGGVQVNAGEVRLYNTTVTGNKDRHTTGGIEVNEEANLILNSSIVSGNTSKWGDNNVNGRYENANSLIDVPANQIFADVDPISGGGVLADNGGPTLTVALNRDKFNGAVDKAPGLPGKWTDQRGELAFDADENGQTERDLGAFELQEASLAYLSIFGEINKTPIEFKYHPGTEEFVILFADGARITLETSAPVKEFLFVPDGDLGMAWSLNRDGFVDVVAINGDMSYDVGGSYAIISMLQTYRTDFISMVNGPDGQVLLLDSKGFLFSYQMLPGTTSVSKSAVPVFDIDEINSRQPVRIGISNAGQLVLYKEDEGINGAEALINTTALSHFDQASLDERLGIIRLASGEVIKHQDGKLYKRDENNVWQKQPGIGIRNLEYSSMGAVALLDNDKVVLISDDDGARSEVDFSIPDGHIIAAGHSNGVTYALSSNGGDIHFTGEIQGSLKVFDQALGDYTLMDIAVSDDAIWATTGSGKLLRIDLPTHSGIDLNINASVIESEGFFTAVSLTHEGHVSLIEVGEEDAIFTHYNPASGQFTPRLSLMGPSATSAAFHENAGVYFTDEDTAYTFTAGHLYRWSAIDDDWVDLGSRDLRAIRAGADGELYGLMGDNVIVALDSNGNVRKTDKLTPDMSSWWGEAITTLGRVVDFSISKDRTIHYIDEDNQLRHIKSGDSWNSYFYGSSDALDQWKVPYTEGSSLMIGDEEIEVRLSAELPSGEQLIVDIDENVYFGLIDGTRVDDIIDDEIEDRHKYMDWTTQQWPGIIKKIYISKQYSFIAEVETGSGIKQMALAEGQWREVVTPAIVNLPADIPTNHGIKSLIHDENKVRWLLDSRGVLFSKKTRESEWVKLDTGNTRLEKLLVDNEGKIAGLNQQGKVIAPQDPANLSLWSVWPWFDSIKKTPRSTFDEDFEQLKQYWEHLEIKTKAQVSGVKHNGVFTGFSNPFKYLSTPFKYLRTHISAGILSGGDLVLSNYWNLEQSARGEFFAANEQLLNSLGRLEKYKNYEYSSVNTFSLFDENTRDIQSALILSLDKLTTELQISSDGWGDPKLQKISENFAENNPKYDKLPLYIKFAERLYGKDSAIAEKLNILSKAGVSTAPALLGKFSALFAQVATDIVSSANIHAVFLDLDKNSGGADISLAGKDVRKIESYLNKRQRSAVHQSRLTGGNQLSVMGKTIRVFDYFQNSMQNPFHKINRQFNKLNIFNASDLKAKINGLRPGETLQISSGWFHGGELATNYGTTFVNPGEPFIGGTVSGSVGQSYQYSMGFKKNPDGTVSLNVGRTSSRVIELGVDTYTDAWRLAQSKAFSGDKRVKVFPEFDANIDVAKKDGRRDGLDLTISGSSLDLASDNTFFDQLFNKNIDPVQLLAQANNGSISSNHKDIHKVTVDVSFEAALLPYLGHVDVKVNDDGTPTRVVGGSSYLFIPGIGGELGREFGSESEQSFNPNDASLSNSKDFSVGFFDGSDGKTTANLYFKGGQFNTRFRTGYQFFGEHLREDKEATPDGGETVYRKQSVNVGYPWYPVKYAAYLRAKRFAYNSQESEKLNRRNLLSTNNLYKIVRDSKGEITSITWSVSSARDKRLFYIDAVQELFVDASPLDEESKKDLKNDLMSLVSFTTAENLKKIRSKLNEMEDAINAGVLSDPDKEKALVLYKEMQGISGFTDSKVNERKLFLDKLKAVESIFSEYEGNKNFNDLRDLITDDASWSKHGNNRGTSVNIDVSLSESAIASINENMKEGSADLKQLIKQEILAKKTKINGFSASRSRSRSSNFQRALIYKAKSEASTTLTQKLASISINYNEDGVGASYDSSKTSGYLFNSAEKQQGNDVQALFSDLGSKEKIVLVGEDIKSLIRSSDRKRREAVWESISLQLKRVLGGDGVDGASIREISKVAKKIFVESYGFPGFEENLESSLKPFMRNEGISEGDTNYHVYYWVDVFVREYDGSNLNNAEFLQAVSGGNGLSNNIYFYNGLIVYSNDQDQLVRVPDDMVLPLLNKVPNEDLKNHIKNGKDGVFLLLESNDLDPYQRRKLETLAPVSSEEFIKTKSNSLVSDREIIERLSESGLDPESLSSIERARLYSNKKYEGKNGYIDIESIKKVLRGETSDSPTLSQVEIEGRAALLTYDLLAQALIQTGKLKQESYDDIERLKIDGEFYGFVSNRDRITYAEYKRILNKLAVDLEFLHKNSDKVKFDELDASLSVFSASENYYSQLFIKDKVFSLSFTQSDTGKAQYVFVDYQWFDKDGQFAKIKSNDSLVLIGEVKKYLKDYHKDLGNDLFFHVNDLKASSVDEDSLKLLKELKTDRRLLFGDDNSNSVTIDGIDISLGQLYDMGAMVGGERIHPGMSLSDPEQQRRIIFHSDILADYVLRSQKNESNSGEGKAQNTPEVLKLLKKRLSISSGNLNSVVTHTDSREIVRLLNLVNEHVNVNGEISPELSNKLKNNLYLGPDVKTKLIGANAIANTLDRFSYRLGTMQSVIALSNFFRRKKSGDYISSEEKKGTIVLGAGLGFEFAQPALSYGLTKFVSKTWNSVSGVKNSAVAIARSSSTSVRVGGMLSLLGSAFDIYGAITSRKLLEQENLTSDQKKDLRVNVALSSIGAATGIATGLALMSGFLVGAATGIGAIVGFGLFLAGSIYAGVRAVQDMSKLLELSKAEKWNLGFFSAMGLGPSDRLKQRLIDEIYTPQTKNKVYKTMKDQWLVSSMRMMFDQNGEENARLGGVVYSHNKAVDLDLKQYKKIEGRVYDLAVEGTDFDLITTQELKDEGVKSDKLKEGAELNRQIDRAHDYLRENYPGMNRSVHTWDDVDNGLYIVDLTIESAHDDYFYDNDKKEIEQLPDFKDKENGFDAIFEDEDGNFDEGFRFIDDESFLNSIQLSRVQYEVLGDRSSVTWKEIKRKDFDPDKDFFLYNTGEGRDSVVANPNYISQFIVYGEWLGKRLISGYRDDVFSIYENEAARVQDLGGTVFANALIDALAQGLTFTEARALLETEGIHPDTQGINMHSGNSFTRPSIFDAGKGIDTLTFETVRSGGNIIRLNDHRLNITDLGDDSIYTRAHFTLSEDQMFIALGFENVMGAEAGKDYIEGNNLANYLDGRGGGDSLYGKAGDDNINLYAGDKANGGMGNDTYFIRNPSSDDFISLPLNTKVIEISEEISVTDQNSVNLDYLLEEIGEPSLEENSSGNFDMHIVLAGGTPNELVLVLKNVYSADFKRNDINYSFLSKDGFMLSPKFVSDLASKNEFDGGFYAYYQPVMDQLIDKEFSTVDLKIQVDVAEGRVVRTGFTESSTSTHIAVSGKHIELLSAGSNLDHETMGGDDDDIIVTGQGKNNVIGGKGSDTYIINVNLEGTPDLPDSSESPAILLGQYSARTMIDNFDPGTLITDEDGQPILDDEENSIYEYADDYVIFNIKRKDIKIRRDGNNAILYYGPDEDVAKVTLKDFLKEEAYQHISLIDVDGVIWELAIDDDGEPYIGNGVLIGDGEQHVDDILEASMETTWIFAGEGNDVIHAVSYLDSEGEAKGGDIIDGGEGNDILYDDAGDNSFMGGAGEDTFYIGKGNDMVITGMGFDVIDLSNASGVKVIDAFSDEFEFNTLILPFDFTEPDVIFVQDGDHLIIQAAEDNNGESPLTIILTNYFYSELNQSIHLHYEQIRWDIRDVYKRATRGEVTRADDTIFLQKESFEHISSDLRRFDALEGHDTIEDILGQEAEVVHEFHGGTGDDLIYAGDGRDNVYGGEGNDRLYGGDGLDQMIGEQGDDFLFDYSDDQNRLFGGEGDDDIRGRGVLDGGQGSDKIVGSDTDDELNSGYGDDVDDINNLYGMGGNDILNGDAGRDFLNGGAGNDTISAGGGDDVLYVSTGADSYDGGAGYDIFSMEDMDDSVVADFNSMTFSDFEIYQDEHGQFRFTGIEEVMGTAFDDTLTFGNRISVLKGGFGNDILISNTNTAGSTAAQLYGGVGHEDYLVTLSAGETVFIVESDGYDILSIDTHFSQTDSPSNFWFELNHETDDLHISVNNTSGEDAQIIIEDYASETADKKVEEIIVNEQKLVLSDIDLLVSHMAGHQRFDINASTGEGKSVQQRIHELWQGSEPYSESSKADNKQSDGANPALSDFYSGVHYKRGSETPYATY